MILQEGKTQEELMQVLKEMDDLTSMDSLVKNEQKLSVECTREGGRLKNWRIKFKPKFRRKPISAGTTYNRFFAALDKLQLEESLFDAPDCTVLCYLSTSPHKDWSGKICSYWAEINPGFPYQVSDGELKFITKKILMDETDFAVLSETGLAFYCESSGVYYPFTKTAYLSMGRFFDAAMAFREVDSHLLGTALLLAERISELPEIRLICRHKNDYMRPILSVVGRRYNLFSQKVFFETLLNHAATKLGVYEISNWTVEDEMTSLTVEYSHPWEEFYFKLTFATGDTPITPFLANLEVVYQNAAIPLVTNTAKHTVTFTEENIPELLTGMSEMMDEYRTLHCMMQNRICNFDAAWLSEIHKALGKKRVSDMAVIESGRYLAKDVWDLVIKTRYVQIPPRQMEDLKRAFKKLFFQMMEHLEAEQATA